MGLCWRSQQASQSPNTQAQPPLLVLLVLLVLLLVLLVLVLLLPPPLPLPQPAAHGLLSGAFCRADVDPSVPCSERSHHRDGNEMQQKGVQH